MKKNSIIILISILVIIVISYSNFKIYSSTYNEKMLNVINEILVNEEVDINIIAKILKSPSESENLLKEYGYEESDLFLISNFESSFNKVLIINIVIVLLVLIVCIMLISKDSNKRKKEISELIRYLGEINNGNYDIDLKSYEEGEFSKLRDQIYKTTVILKENEDFLLTDKRNLKNNLTDISHQLKTPLTSIMLMIENMIDDEIDKKRKDYLTKIYEQSDKIKYLIEVLLKLARLDASVVEFKADRIKSDKLINKVILNLDYLIKEKNITINILLKNIGIINCDKKWQEEALTNILKNCIENSNDNGIIDIILNKNNFYTSIIIKDYGKGMSEDLQKKIFERFKKSENSNGIGIGLNLAKTIIEKDKGMIIIDSKEFEYSKFEIKYMK